MTQAILLALTRTTPVSRFFAVMPKGLQGKAARTNRRSYKHVTAKTLGGV